MQSLLRNLTEFTKFTKKFLFQKASLSVVKKRKVVHVESKSKLDVKRSFFETEKLKSHENKKAKFWEERRKQFQHTPLPQQQLPAFSVQENVVVSSTNINNNIDNLDVGKLSIKISKSVDEPNIIWDRNVDTTTSFDQINLERNKKAVAKERLLSKQKQLRKIFSSKLLTLPSGTKVYIIDPPPDQPILIEA